MFTHAFVPKNSPTNIYHHNCLLSRPVPGCQKPSAGLGDKRYCWLMITVEYTTHIGQRGVPFGQPTCISWKDSGGGFCKKWVFFRQFPDPCFSQSTGGAKVEYPCVPGHELAGVVKQIGSHSLGRSEAPALLVGNRVILQVFDDLSNA